MTARGALPHALGSWQLTESLAATVGERGRRHVRVPVCWVFPATPRASPATAALHSPGSSSSTRMGAASFLSARSASRRASSTRASSSETQGSPGPHRSGSGSAKGQLFSATTFARGWLLHHGPGLPGALATGASARLTRELSDRSQERPSSRRAHPLVERHPAGGPLQGPARSPCTTRRSSRAGLARTAR